MCKMKLPLLIAVFLTGACGSIAQAEQSAYYGAEWGPINEVQQIALIGSATNVNIEALNEGVCMRFRATSTKDIKSVVLRWGGVTGAGAVSVRVETIDATSGKCSGTLYDANAVLAGQTPQNNATVTYTFATLPTAGLTVGTEYGIMVLTTTGGTSHNLTTNVTADSNVATYSTILLTCSAVDCTTRSNLSETASAIPIFGLVLEDDSTDFSGGYPYYTVNNRNIFGTTAAAAKITTVGTMTVAGVVTKTLNRVGTPAGDLRIRIFNSSDTLVTGADVTIDKDSLTGSDAKRSVALFGAGTVVLPAGTYRVVYSCASCADSSNCWRIKSATGIQTGLASAFATSTTADITATPPTWSDVTTDHMPVSLLIENLVASKRSNMLMIGVQ